MALIKSVRGFDPKFGSNCYFAENSTIIGDVVLGNDCSIWFNTIIRGDVNSIRIGNRVNIQDGAVIHCNYKDSVTIIRDDVSVGHNAVVHGATLENNVLIGMGAIIMDHAIIGESSVIAAGTVITKHTIIKPGSVFGGVPGKLLKSYEPDQLKRLTLRSAQQYLMYKEWFEDEN
jgi:carbonic anhydrase/acetyltransferase-like protein (isoleucine patch superfamily)